jgi:uncharacterized protein (TIGR02145 family)
MKIATLLFIAIVSISSVGFAQSVTIGTQTWTTKNLDVATFRNGEAIPQAKTDEEWKAAGKNKQAAWCYYENNSENGTKYGKLYNWYAVNDARGLAPAGYHIPTDEEWTVLSTFLGGKDVAGKKMKSTSGWNDDGNGTNSSGFSGLPGGCRFGNGIFNGRYGYWWSASEYDETVAWLWNLDDYYSILYRGRTLFKDNGLSVRCVRD